MPVKEHNATIIDDAAAYGNADILEEVFNNIEADMLNGNSVALVHDTVEGVKATTKEFNTLEDLYNYRRRVTNKPLSSFEKRIGGRIYRFKRSPMLLEVYDITIHEGSSSITFRMEKRGDDGRLWEINAQTLPTDVYGVGLELHDAIEWNENGE